MGGIGQYNTTMKKNGKHTAHTAAKANGLAFPLPDETYHIAIPTTPPTKVAMIRAARPKVVSPRKRAIVS